MIHEALSANQKNKGKENSY